MRPPVADVGPPRSRKSSLDQSVPPWTDPRDVIPTTFFLTTRQHDQDEEDDRSPGEPGTGGDSMYGVQSLEETIQQASLTSSLCELPDPGSRSVDSVRRHANLASFHQPAGEPRPTHDPVTVEAPPLRRRSTIRPFDVLASASRRDSSRQPSGGASSRPLSPPGLGRTIDSCSLPSSPKSLSDQSMKPLDDISITDELNSQTMASGEEDDEPLEASTGEPDNPSQLIMPSIRMPSRRPFTDRGKAMGRFKLLLAGASSSGKTSLIKSLVQVCEDIVHVDEVPAPRPPRPRPSRSRTAQRPNSVSETTCVEIYASTKPYPPWWSGLEDSRILRRRKSTGDMVLERNLCFVDTVGNDSSQPHRTDTVVQYMHQQLLRATSAVHAANAADFQNLLAGNGGSQVDAILYLISEDTLDGDMECMQKLCELCNVIPVIAKADLLSPSQIRALRVTFQDEARRAGVKPFFFDTPEDGQGDPAPQSPLAVSSAKSNDEDNMDASLLMSPDYVQPLVASELHILVDHLFQPDNMAWLRHSAAKKLSVRRFHLQPTAPVTSTTQQTPHSPLSIPGSFSGLTASSVASLCSSSDGILAGSPPSYAIARLADYTRQEEALAQVRLAKWATGLQRSLQNERERYAALARGDRAVWLTERLSECIVDGTLVPISQTPGLCERKHDQRQSPRSSGSGSTSRSERERGGGGLILRTSSPLDQTQQPVSHGMSTQTRNLVNLDTHDPLGVVCWSDDLKRRGWMILQIVGSFGVVGGLALWLARTWNLPSQSQSRGLLENTGSSSGPGQCQGQGHGQWLWHWNYCFDWCGTTTATAGCE